MNGPPPPWFAVLWGLAWGITGTLVGVSLDLEVAVFVTPVLSAATYLVWGGRAYRWLEAL